MSHTMLTLITHYTHLRHTRATLRLGERCAPDPFRLEAARDAWRAVTAPYGTRCGHGGTVLLPGLGHATVTAISAWDGGGGGGGGGGVRTVGSGSGVQLGQVTQQRLEARTGESRDGEPRCPPLRRPARLAQELGQWQGRTKEGRRRRAAGPCSRHARAPVQRDVPSDCRQAQFPDRRSRYRVRRQRSELGSPHC